MLLRCNREYSRRSPTASCVYTRFLRGSGARLRLDYAFDLAEIDNDDARTAGHCDCFCCCCLVLDCLAHGPDAGASEDPEREDSDDGLRPSARLALR